MELRLEPELNAKLKQWSAQTGRPASDLVEDALAAHLAELGELRATLDARHQEVVTGNAHLLDHVDAYRFLKERVRARRQSGK